MNNNFEDSIARMKALYTYGTVSENKKQSTSTLEYSAKAADGKTYGIVRECNHWYIKQAADGKEKLAEGYDYIGGYMNKRNYQYDSYNSALKNLELKLSSINEACEGKVNISTLDPFKKEIVLAESSDKMKNEIARQRQIMYNAGMIMNEAKDYAVKGGPACSTAQPEAETGKKGDKAEGSKEAKANPEYEGSHVEPIKKAEPFEKNPVKESCDNKSCDTDFDAGVPIFGSTENGEADTEHNNDPFTQSVNEEGEKEWDKGLPGSEGIGEADTDHNNDPFNKNVNEGIEDELGDDELSDDDWDDEDFDLDDDLEDIDLDEPEDELGDDATDTDLDAGVEDVEGSLEDGEEMVDETDPESVRSEIERLQGILDSLEGGEDELGDDAVEGDVAPEGEDIDNAPIDDEDGFGAEGEDDFDEDDFQFEGKQAFMDSIVESVVKSILKEDELHDFGKHPGYRKKPMDLPPTGEDKNEHGEDINDDSVHNEEPFGKQIGDSSPFNQLVNAVTQDVLYQLKHGVPLDNKKKEE